MPTDFTISLFHRPGTLAAASAALGSAGINIEGACAYVCDETGVYHLLVDGVVCDDAVIEGDRHVLERLAAAAPARSGELLAG